MTQWIVLLLVAFLMMSCARTYDRQVEFNPEEYAPYVGTGTARVCGQAYLNMEDGKPHVASGDRVLLAPATSYTEEAIMVKVTRGRKMVDPAPEAMKFEQHTKTDADGRSTFLSLDKFLKCWPLNVRGGEIVNLPDLLIAPCLCAAGSPAKKISSSLPSFLGFAMCPSSHLATI